MVIRGLGVLANGIKSRQRARIASICAAAFAVGACAALPTTPDTIYDLTAPMDVRVSSGTRAQILIPEPSSPKALDTDRIAGRPDFTQYAYVPDAVWSDRLPRLLQNRLMETLQNTGRVHAVGLPGQGLLIDYQIILDLRAFEVIGNQGVVAFSAKLLNDRNGRVVAARTFDTDVAIMQSGTPAAVAALDLAMDEAFTSLANWVLRKI